METHEIKALMMLKKVTSASIAKKENVSRTWVSLVLTGRRNSPRIRKAIATAVGWPVTKLWPDMKKAA